MIYSGKMVVITQEYLAWYLAENGSPSVFVVGEELPVINSYPSVFVVLRHGKRYRIGKHWFRPMYSRWLEVQLYQLGRKWAAEVLDSLNQL